jgi:hypothetical protein
MLQNYLSSTISQEWPNGLTNLCIEKRLLDEDDINTIFFKIVLRTFCIKKGESLLQWGCNTPCYKNTNHHPWSTNQVVIQQLTKSLSKKSNPNPNFYIIKSNRNFKHFNHKAHADNSK